MSAARLKTWLVPSTADRAAGRRRRASSRFSASGWNWYQSSRGFTSTARTEIPSARSASTRWPPMKPPPPATSTVPAMALSGHPARELVLEGGHVDVDHQLDELLEADLRLPA